MGKEQGWAEGEGKLQCEPDKASGLATLADNFRVSPVSAMDEMAWPGRGWPLYSGGHC